MKERAKLLFCTPMDSADFPKLWSRDAEAAAERLGFQLDLLRTAPAGAGGWNRLLRGYDGVVTSWGAPQFNAELLEGNTRLRIVGHAAGSVADLVSDELFARGIKVVSANDTMAGSVAEWCLAASILGFGRALEFLRFGGGEPLRWENRGRVRSLRDAAIGIWGFGAIARSYLELLKPFTPARILVHSDFASDVALAEWGAEPASLERVFAEADVVVLLAGLNNRNIERVDGGLLRSLRDGATLINYGRARLIREEDLMVELERRRFSAFFDVFYREPLPVDSPLYRLPNVVLTPHVAGLGGIRRFIPDVLENFGHFFRGEPLRGEITRERAAAMTSHKKALTV